MNNEVEEKKGDKAEELKKKNDNKKKLKKQEQLLHAREPSLIQKLVHMNTDDDLIINNNNKSSSYYLSIFQRSIWSIVFLFYYKNQEKRKIITFKPKNICLNENLKLSDGSFQLSWDDQDMNMDDDTKNDLDQILFHLNEETIHSFHISIYVQSIAILNLQVNQKTIQHNQIKMSIKNNTKNIFEGVKIKCCESSCYIQFIKQQQEEMMKSTNGIKINGLFCINKTELLMTLSKSEMESFDSLFDIIK